MRSYETVNHSDMVRWEAGVDQSAFEHNEHDVFAFFISCNQLLKHEYYVFPNRVIKQHITDVILFIG